MNRLKNLNKITFSFIIGLLFLILIACSNLVNNEDDIKKPVIIKEEFKELPLKEEITQLDTDTVFFEIKKSPYKELFTRNNDYIGWISIDNTNIDFPILKGEDNDEYLRRNFDYNYDKKGSIFMDYRNFGFSYSKNTILYGHNLKDNTMFGDLKNYSDSSYGLTHNIIEITDLYETRNYQVFSSYFSDADSLLIKTDFSSDTYNTYLLNAIDLSLVDYNLIPNSDDSILTLVTCSYEIDDGRFYVHAVEIKE